MPAGPTSILITGASSGIGRALALNYARPGVQLALSGRNEERLEDVSERCRASGAEVAAASVDVRARKEIAQWVCAVDDRHPIDLAIASAGITNGIGMGRPHEDPDAVRSVIYINLIGTLNTLDPVIERMCARGRGQVAFMGSISAVRAMPYWPAYCATKAALHAYAEALRPNLASQGVDVSLIVPGFVATALNRDFVGPMPLVMSEERAARIIRRGLDRRTAVIAFPRSLYIGAWLLRLLPARLADWALSRIHYDTPETRERATDA